jgi:hypothetical protein
MTPAQCRAARGLIRMTINALGEAAAVPATTVWDYESEIGEPQAAEVAAMRKALENAGVEFIEDGIKLRKGT